MSKQSSHEDRVDSWKHIAAYLGRDVRTVIRWEKDRGLPIRRIPGGRRKAVFAYTEELDAWLGSENTDPVSPTVDRVEQVKNGASRVDCEGAGLESQGSIGTTRERTSEIARPPLNQNGSRNPTKLSVVLSFPRHTLFLFGPPLLFLIVTILVLKVFTTNSNALARLEFTPNSMQVFDVQNHLRWSYTFPGALESSQLYPGKYETEELSKIADFRQDGEQEVLVATVLKPDIAQSPTETRVCLLSSKGLPLWEYVPNKVFQFGNHELRGPWVIRNSMFTVHKGRIQLWLSFADSEWSNSFVINVDPRSGKDILRYVNTGSLRTLNELRVGDRHYLLAGGFNNESDSASLGIVDENRSFAASPQGSGTRHECVSCPSGVPDYYVIFPRAELYDIMGVHEDMVSRVVVNGNSIEVIKGGPTAEFRERIHYMLQFDGEFRLLSIRFNSDYDTTHRRLEMEGKLDHKLENCPERLHPRALRIWTPTSGWSEVTVPPTRFDE